MKKILLPLFCAAIALCSHAKECAITSPDGRVAVTVTDTPTLQFSVAYDGVTIVEPSAIGLDVEGLDQRMKITSAKKSEVHQQVASPFYRQASIADDCHVLTLGLGKDITLAFRAYDSGVAYRFGIAKKGESIVVDETARYSFAPASTVWLSHSTNEKQPMAMAFQNVYAVTPLDSASSQLAFLPATVDAGGVKVTILESDLESYPGMFLKAEGGSLNAVFAHYPKATDYYPWRKQLYVTDREDYIAKVSAPRQLPWRVLAISTADTQMPVNDLVYLLASPSRVADTSWIKPGKVAWDWWNDWGLTGVDFATGINMDTYKYYIDFAAANGLEYVILDEGWYVPTSGDMLTTIPEIDLPALVQYGAERGVGLILWTVFNVLDDQLEQACDTYAAMGVKGFKVDFLDRDDQTAVEMAYRLADACAKHGLVLDYHGYYKPTGLNRTYPNVINFEAVFGMEEARWAGNGIDMPLYDVTFPYIRMMAGPVDFTPGAMRNGTRENYRAIYNQPMSMGTRAHQAGTYVVYDSPLTMLADSPTAYEADMPCTRFLASLPVETDETIVLDGKLGEYIVTARRLGDDYRVGGLTNWDGRDIVVDFSFLPEGVTFNATLLADGKNANHLGEDYAITTFTVTNADTLPITMASGGGFAMSLTPASK